MFAAATLVAWLGVVGVCQAGPVNLGFETGDISGWTASNPALVAVVSEATKLVNYSPAGVWNPTEGKYFAWLLSGHHELSGREQATRITTLSQTFDVEAGETLCFNVFFDAGDYFPYNDGGAAVLYRDGNLYATLYEKSISDVGDWGEDGWTQIHYTFQEGGKYTLEFAVWDGVDTINPSAMGIDICGLYPTTTIVDTPEPSSFALAGLGGLFLIARRRRR
jgi:hypothetical protein